MADKRKNQDREARFDNDIVVDAYNAAERAMGWYYYLEEKLQFPAGQRSVGPVTPATTDSCAGATGTIHWGRPVNVVIRIQNTARSTMNAVLRPDQYAFGIQVRFIDPGRAEPRARMGVGLQTRPAHLLNHIDVARPPIVDSGQMNQVRAVVSNARVRRRGRWDAVVSRPATEQRRRRDRPGPRRQS
jgi:hypothetical protein